MNQFVPAIFSFVFISVGAVPLPSYWFLRNQILIAEEQNTLGGNLVLRTDEITVNNILMTAKQKELDEAFTNSEKFPPARNFLEAKDDIERSEVFQIIRELPKGGVLHAHSSAISSSDFIFSNITRLPNLYVCDENGEFHLLFFDEPSSTCDWQLLSELRKDPNVAHDLDERIRRALTMAVEDPEKEYPNVDKAWEKFSDIFSFISPMLKFRPAYEIHFYNALKELYDDNILYLELRTSLPRFYELNGKVYSPAESVGIHKQIVDRFMRDHPDFYGMKLIFAPTRQIPQEKLEDYLEVVMHLKELYPDFVAGFDLVGQEDKGEPLIRFADQLKNVNPNIHFFFHAGETNWNGMSTDQNLIDAVLLNSKRIGHGYAVLKHPLLLRDMRERGIAIEINPISNQVLGLVKDLRNHPASTLFATGFPVVVSNDDPGLWGAKGLSFDFYEAFMGIMSRNADLRALKQLALNSLFYSGMSEREKGEAYMLWQNKWDNFIQKIISNNYNRTLSE